MEFLELSLEEYDAFARNHAQRNYLSSANAFTLKAKQGREICFVGVKVEGNIVAASGLAFIPVMKKYHYAYAQRGLLVDYDNEAVLTFFVESLKTYLKQKKVLYLKIDPYVFYRQRDHDGNIVEDGFNNHAIVERLITLGFIHQGFTVGFSSDSQCRFMMTLSLEGKDESTLLKEMDQQTRWSINKALKLGIKVKTLSKEELPLFEKMMEDTAKRRHFENVHIDYLAQIDAFGKDNAKLYMAYIDVDAFLKQIQEDRAHEKQVMNEIQEVLKKTPGSKKFLKKEKVSKEALDLIVKREKEALAMKEAYGDLVPLAVAYFVTYEDEVVYVASASNAELKKYNGPYAIQWYKICEALKQNIKRYNFYGTTGDFTKNAEDYGVFEFKKGFNAVAEELIGDFILPIDKKAYQRYCILLKIKRKIKG